MALVNKLVDAAKQARDKAYAPYSNFCVGAAILSEDGCIYTGANVENSSFGVSFCAERTALGAAITAGERCFKYLVIVSDSAYPPMPCGICRQALMEFSPDLVVITVNNLGEKENYFLKELLPHAFKLEK